MMGYGLIFQFHRCVGVKSSSILINPFKVFRRNYAAGIKISSVRKDEYKKVSDFLLENFYQEEPMGIALGLNVDKEVRNWFPKYVKAHFEKSIPISSQAVEESTGKLVGVNFAIVIDPRMARPPLMVDFVDPQTQVIKYQICVFLDEIEEGLNAAELLGIKSLASDDNPIGMENLMISVHKDFYQRGIAKELIKKTEAKAVKIKNCLAAKVVTTSEWSHQAFLKCGFQVIREFQFDRYKNPDGVKIFDGKIDKLGVHTSSRVMIKDLTTILKS